MKIRIRDLARGGHRFAYDGVVVKRWDRGRMAEERFSITYDGEGLSAGRMDIRELAPSLLAFGNLLHGAQGHLFADEPGVRVDIAAAPETGSLVVNLVAEHAGLLEQAANLLTSTGVGAVGNLSSLLQAVIGLLNLTKRTGGQSIETVDELADGETRIQFGDGEELRTTAPVVELYRQREFRKEARNFVDPLIDEGIDEIRVRTSQGSSELRTEDRASFVPPSAEEDADEYVTTATMRIEGINFSPSNKWRLYHGETPYWVTIDDSAFLDRVHRRKEVFAQGDHLRIRFRTREWMADGKVRADHIVDEVLEHLKAPDVRQGRLEVGDDT